MKPYWKKTAAKTWERLEVDTGSRLGSRPRTQNWIIHVKTQRVRRATPPTWKMMLSSRLNRPMGMVMNRTTMKPREMTNASPKAESEGMSPS